MDTNDNDLPKDPEDEALRAQFLEEMRRRREEQEKKEQEEKRFEALEKKKPMYMRRSSGGTGGISGLLARFGIEDERSANVVMIVVIVIALGASVWVLRGAFSGGSKAPVVPPVTSAPGSTSGGLDSTP